MCIRDRYYIVEFLCAAICIVVTDLFDQRRVVCCNRDGTRITTKSTEDGYSLQLTGSIANYVTLLVAQCDTQVVCDIYRTVQELTVMQQD